MLSRGRCLILDVSDGGLNIPRFDYSAVSTVVGSPASSVGGGGSLEPQPTTETRNTNDANTESQLFTEWPFNWNRTVVPKDILARAEIRILRVFHHR